MILTEDLSRSYGEKLALSRLNLRVEPGEFSDFSGCSRPLHVLVHVALLGVVSHLLLQAAILIDPELPFSRPAEGDAVGGALRPDVRHGIDRSVSAVLHRLAVHEGGRHAGRFRDGPAGERRD
jgi:hypothetical protein